MTFATRLVVFLRDPRVLLPCHAIMLVGFLGSALAGNVAGYLFAVLLLILVCVDIYQVQRHRRQKSARDE